MTLKFKSSSPLLVTKPWAENDNNIWLASTLKLSRNLDNFLFPAKLKPDKRSQIRSLVSKSLLTIPQLSSPQMLKAEEIDAFEKEYLLEHYLVMQSFHQADNCEAFIIDTTGEFFSVLNVHDHIQIQVSDFKGELEKSWNRLCDIEMALGKSINYAFNPKFGFLTADPAGSGTGLVVHIFLHLPALIHTGQIKTALQKYCIEGISSTGFQGDPTSLIGDVLVLHNHFTLGLTEEDILTSLRNSLTKIIVAEKSARTLIRNTQNTGMMDKVSRAYGLLLHSYQIETIEAMNSISLVKLGIELEWIKGVHNNKLNELFFNCRRAHLVAHFQESIAPEQLPHKRAELIHSVLKPSQLMI